MVNYYFYNKYKSKSIRFGNIDLNIFKLLFYLIFNKIK